MVNRIKINNPNKGHSPIWNDAKYPPKKNKELVNGMVYDWLYSGRFTEKRTLTGPRTWIGFAWGPPPKTNIFPTWIPQMMYFSLGKDIKYVKICLIWFGESIFYSQIYYFPNPSILQQSHENPPNFPCSFAVPPWSAQDTAQCTTASGVVRARLVVPFGDARLPCLWDFMGKIVI